MKFPKAIFPILLLLAGGYFLAAGSGVSLPSFSFVAKDPDAWLVILEESDSRDIDLAILLQNQPWRQSLIERKVNFRVLDDDQSEAASYVAVIEERPAYLFVSQTGRVLKKGSSPKTVKAANQLIAEVIGK